jgi:hypothetical protein
MTSFLRALQDVQEATIQRLRRWSTSAADLRRELPTLTLLDYRSHLDEFSHHSCRDIFVRALQDLQEATIQRLRRWSTSAVDMRSELPTLTAL